MIRPSTESPVFPWIVPFLVFTKGANVSAEVLTSPFPFISSIHSLITGSSLQSVAFAMATTTNKPNRRGNLEILQKCMMEFRAYL